MTMSSAMDTASAQSVSGTASEMVDGGERLVTGKLGFACVSWSEGAETDGTASMAGTPVASGI